MRLIKNAELGLIRDVSCYGMMVNAEVYILGVVHPDSWKCFLFEDLMSRSKTIDINVDRQNYYKSMSHSESMWDLIALITQAIRGGSSVQI